MGSGNMAIDTDDEILQDFLVEAGEILEDLGNQLVDLEQNSDDPDLLNAVFRGFHTIKGGASFLSLEPLVGLCHLAEDVFNLLRNGERQVDARLMDVILPVLDSLNEMFDYLRDGQMPPDADPAQLQALDAILKGEEAPEAAPAAEAAAPAPAETEAAGDEADDEFEAMLEASAGETADTSESGSGDDAASDEITDDEFEALLDQMHGKGKFNPDVANDSSGDSATESAASEPASDEISDDEFDALLNELHGSAGVPGAKPAASGQSSEAPKEEPPKAEPPKAEPPKAEPPKAEPPKAEAPKAEPAAEAPAAKPAPPRKPPAREAAQTESTVRVDTRRLDDIMNLVGELVLVRNRLSTLQTTVENEHVSAAVSNLDVVTADLQNAVMKTRMQPIKKVFGRFPRVVRDLARSLSKEINLEMEGEDTDLDKNLVEALADPLVHLVRNAVDHGIEMPDEREAAGKSRTGRVLLKASQEGDHIELSISDDGKGMDPDKLRKIAVDKGLMDEDAADRLSERDCYNLIFAPGFSTKQEISDISGRGVGMDVVKTRIVQLNGSVEVDSKLGEGSILLIKVPLTLAIMPTLMVVLGTQTFALPLVNVSEIFDLDLRNTNVIDGQQVILVRDKPLPLYYLRDWLASSSIERDKTENSHVVIVSVGRQRIGFVVDELLGQEEVVIKPLGAMLQGTDGMAGATITGDGNIALILDVAGLLKAYARRM